jgi:cytochrome c
MKTYRTLLAALAVATAAAVPAAVQAQEGDAKAGERIFKRCAACHRVGEGAKNAIGPELNDLFGRKAGSVEGFKYSPIMPAMGEAGMVWNRETFSGYVHDPRGWLVQEAKKLGLDCNKLKNCRNRMQFAGLRKDEEINDVIAYLLTFDSDGMPAGGDTAKK